MTENHTDFYARQISLTEWLESIGHRDSAAMRQEDNEKRERLAAINRLTGLPYDKPHQFPATAVAQRTPDFKRFLEDHGRDLCAIRLIPLQPDLPKLRVRGHSIKQAVAWFDQQTIEPSDYRVDFVPHSEKTLWASTFVVNQHGIFGEITSGPHSDLTQGLYRGKAPITFSYDYAAWQLSENDATALGHLKEITAWLKVETAATRVKLTTELEATFAHDYLEGYFETSAPAEGGLWFIDYNRILGKLYADFIEPQKGPASQKALLSGRVGCAGTATGRVRIVSDADLASAQLAPDEILVCRMTTPDYVPLMKQAAAIVTDLGGILSHAAIVARELKKPCITGTKAATAKLENDMKIMVDADRGVITLA